MASAFEMVQLLKDALAKNAGVSSINVDGQSITFTKRSEMISELAYWERKAATAKGRRSLFRGVNLDSSW